MLLWTTCVVAFCVGGQEHTEGVRCLSVVQEVVVKMGAYGLYDVLELFEFIQVCGVLDQGIEEAHALKDIGKVS